MKYDKCIIDKQFSVEDTLEYERLDVRQTNTYTNLIQYSTWTDHLHALVQTTLDIRGQIWVQPNRQLRVLLHRQMGYQVSNEEIQPKGEKLVRW